MHFNGLRNALAAMLFSIGLGTAVQAQPDLSSINLDRLTHFWQAMEDTNKPVTVLSFGDSMSESGRSIQLELFGRLRSEYGIGGRGLLTAWLEAVWEFGNGAYKEQQTANWWTVHAVVPPGGYIYYRNLQDPANSVLCDSVGVFWVAHPGGGDFTLSISTNGGDWSPPLLSLQGYSDQPVGCCTNLSVNRDKYRIRLDGVSGTNLVLGPRYLDSAAGGVDVAFMAKGGANLNQIFNLSTNVLYPILSALDPQLVVFHMKEVGDIGATGLSNRLYDSERLWEHCVPNGDILYIGTPWEALDLTTNRTETQNILIREAAVRDNRCYVDCMTPMVSYQWMTNHGYMADTIHLSDTGNQFLADFLWQELGFYALRLDRTLNLSLSPEGMVFDWATRTGLAFELQSATNIASWDSLHSRSGDGSRHTWTNSPDASNAFYRLRITEE